MAGSVGAFFTGADGLGLEAAFATGFFFAAGFYATGFLVAGFFGTARFFGEAGLFEVDRFLGAAVFFGSGFSGASETEETTGGLRIAWNSPMGIPA